MFEKFDSDAREATVSAQEAARSLDDGRIGTEHLLVGLLQEAEGAAARALNQHGATIDRVRTVLDGWDLRHPPTRRRHVPFTKTAKKSMELALREALRLNQRSINGGHVLLGVLRSEGNGTEVLDRLGVDRKELRGTAERLARSA